ncbi:MAG: aminotransferase class V-fold PLP-dependent enzyme, partial [Verrucomicrobiota bacterium]|nr:aminotransferase class V-fold PLP-dependent enzyme [Verrucomicrobiota bacterium]
NLLASLDLPKLLPSPNNAPDRVETGTQNFEGMAGATAAVDLLASFGEGETRREQLRAVFDQLHQRGSALFAQMWAGLSALDGVRVYGPPPNAPRTPTMAFTVQGVSSTEVSQQLAERAVFASHGDFYATTLVERLGQAHKGVVRAGCACYTTAEEVERLIDGVREIAKGR